MKIHSQLCCKQFSIKWRASRSPSFPFSAFANFDSTHWYLFCSEEWFHTNHQLASIKILSHLILSLTDNYSWLLISFSRMEELQFQQRLKLEVLFFIVPLVSSHHYLLYFLNCCCKDCAILALPSIVIHHHRHHHIIIISFPSYNWH